VTIMFPGWSLILLWRAKVSQPLSQSNGPRFIYLVNHKVYSELHNVWNGRIRIRIRSNSLVIFHAIQTARQKKQMWGSSVPNRLALHSKLLRTSEPCTYHLCRDSKSRVYLSRAGEPYTCPLYEIAHIVCS
jgi:hypothetical protein